MIAFNGWNGNSLQLIFTIVVSFLVTIGLMSVLRKMAVKVRFIDIPNERKIHDRPIPRMGGISMAVGILAPVAFFFSQPDRFVLSLLVGSIVLLVFGVLDDLYGLKPGIKLIGQLAAASIIIFNGRLLIRDFGDLLPPGFTLPEYLAVPLTFLAIVGVTNAINFSDGLDGLAGGLSMLVFLFIAYFAYNAGRIDLALIAVAVVGAILGFLRFNTYPATVFMGDAGSQLLGFLGVCLALAITQGSTSLNRMLPLLLLGFPVLDTITVMVERRKKNQSLFVADKNHLHHKLLRLGFFQPEAVAIIYMLQLVLILLAFTFRFNSERCLLGLYLLYCWLVLGVFRLADSNHWRRKEIDIFDNTAKSSSKQSKTALL